MPRYLLDTNHASQALTRNVEWLSRLARRTGDFGVCMPTVGELWYMVYNSRRVTENSCDLRVLLSIFTAWDYDGDAAAEFGRIRVELKSAGRPIPAIDVQIAAIARSHGLIVLSSDRHFRHIADLKVEDWLTPEN